MNFIEKIKIWFGISDSHISNKLEEQNIESSNELESEKLNKKFAAGEQAEKLFEEQARREKYIVEKIPQDQANLKKYSEHAEKSVKRADFIVRNFDGADIDVEVKCLTAYKGKDNKQYYYLPYSQFVRHRNMDDLINSNTVFAFYEIKDDTIIESSLRMVELSYLSKQKNLYDKDSKCLIIPIQEHTKEQFKIFKIVEGRKNA